MEPATKANEQELIYYDESSFERMFKAHYKALHAYASVILRDETVAEEIVQNMFLKLWEKRHQIGIQTSMKAYLYPCVYNDSLNHLKHLKVRANYETYSGYAMKGETVHPAKDLAVKELERQLHDALNELPEQCRTIFQLSRFEEMKYREIADQLGLSIKTIEKQMGKALKALRLHLAEYLTIILLLFTPHMFN